MSEFAARIGRVRLKGGADVVILPDLRPWNDTTRAMLESAQHIAAEDEPHSRMTGYAIIALYSNGAKNVCYSIDSDNPVPVSLLPAYIAEVVRSGLLARESAHRAIDEVFE